jgi:hypothetical protein
LLALIYIHFEKHHWNSNFAQDAPIMHNRNFDYHCDFGTLTNVGGNLKITKAFFQKQEFR